MFDNDVRLFIHYRNCHGVNAAFGLFLWINELSFRCYYHQYFQSWQTKYYFNSKKPKSQCIRMCRCNCKIYRIEWSSIETTNRIFKFFFVIKFRMNIGVGCNNEWFPWWWINMSSLHGGEESFIRLFRLDGWKGLMLIVLVGVVYFVLAMLLFTMYKPS